MKDVCNAGDTATNIIVLGTTLHRECIVCKLQTTGGWESKVWKSIIEWPKNLWQWDGPWKDILLAHDDPDREAKARAVLFRSQRGYGRMRRVRPLEIQVETTDKWHEN